MHNVHWVEVQVRQLENGQSTQAKFGVLTEYVLGGHEVIHLCA
jgi:hypothetical protein